MNKIWIIAIAVVVLIGGVMVSSYNGLISMSEQVNSQWSQVDNQLQRRSDLIPNLVNTVKGYAAHEQQAIQSVSDARAKLGGAQSPADKSAANDQLSGALGRLMMIVENYPDLKANQNFQALQDELADTENRIAVARRDYNNVVQVYNARIRSFPTSVLARVFGFESREYFKAAEGAKETPKVQF